MDAPALKQELLAEARRLGFASAGVTSVAPFTRARRRALDAIDAGRMDGMSWFTRERVEAASDLRSRYPWARSLLALGWPYAPAKAPKRAVAPPAPASHSPRPPSRRVPPPSAPPTPQQVSLPPAPQSAPGRPRGRMSAYACLQDGGEPVDYHTLLARRCDDLVGWLRQREPAVRAKRFIDHGWAMDRPVAERAGIGFAGKHSQLITREAGSYVLLAELLLSAELPADAPSRRGCGSCSACLPACPTGAIVSPGVIDAPRCIAYLTIEHRGPIPEPLRPLIGVWAFGCDLCQEACPINERLAPPAQADPGRGTASGPVPFPDLIECLQLDDESFSRRFRNTAVWRTGRAGLARNCAIALGNAGDRAALPALQAAHESDADEVVRDAAGWAIAQLTAS